MKNKNEKCVIAYCRNEPGQYLNGMAVCDKHIEEPEVWEMAAQKAREAKAVI